MRVINNSATGSLCICRPPRTRFLLRKSRTPTVYALGAPLWGTKRARHFCDCLSAALQAYMGYGAWRALRLCATAGAQRNVKTLFKDSGCVPCARVASAYVSPPFAPEWGARSLAHPPLSLTASYARAGRFSIAKWPQFVSTFALA